MAHANSFRPQPQSQRCSTAGGQRGWSLTSKQGIQTGPLQACWQQSALTAKDVMSGGPVGKEGVGLIRGGRAFELRHMQDCLSARFTKRHVALHPSWRVTSAERVIVPIASIITVISGGSSIKDVDNQLKRRRWISDYGMKFRWGARSAPALFWVASERA